MCTILLQHHGLLRERQNIGMKKSALPPISDAERKLILSFLYYLILGIVATVSLSSSSKNKNEISLKLKDYFLCRSSATVPAYICQHFKDEADLLMNTGLIAAPFTLIALFPIIHLFYVITISSLFRRQNGKSVQPIQRTSLYTH